MQHKAPTLVTTQGIDVVLFNSPVTLSGLIKKLSAEVNEFSSPRPKLIVFPEGIFGESAIERNFGKYVAKKVHDIIGNQKDVFVFYSLFETGAKHILTNSGYLIYPKNYPSKRPYAVYPKMTTYRNGTQLTDFDLAVSKANNLKETTTAQRLRRMARIIPQFPRVEIHGKIIELRICADVKAKSFQDKDYKARNNPIPADIIIVPASTIWFHQGEYAEMAKSLNPMGIAVVNDQINGSRIIKKLDEAGKLKITQIAYRNPPRLRLNTGVKITYEKSQLKKKRFLSIRPLLKILHWRR
ncbi:MAG: hypothetical protein NTY48_00420 [Candidatus Diapherotrites archaeon]|nr:hypothetical protein [Candidatus Diapherotrites archaeon]